jgi:hypothetical protein
MRQSVKCLAAIAMAGLVLSACRGEHEGAGVIEGVEIPAKIVDAREAVQKQDATQLARRVGATRPGKQILFGDLHVHSTFSTDAFMMSLPIMQGEGAHPVADACDFARYCSAVDFWSINDHAEGLTPRRWLETKEVIRECNAVAGDAANPDVVAFLGWEWTQVGRTPEDHYGHKNVIFRDLEEEQVPRRPIHSAGFTARAMRSELPSSVRYGPVVLDWPNRQRYLNLNHYMDEQRQVLDCPAGVDTRDLPADCVEGAATPQVLFEKLDQWGFDTLVIPHGTTWGIYTPAGSSWDKQLTRAQHDPRLQTLVEVFSGHGNSEEYRPWRAVSFDAHGEARCPERQDGFEPCCWRAGEIIRGRCDDPSSPECEARVIEARRNFLAAGSAGRHSIIGAEMSEWGNCGSCPDCFLGSMKYRPLSSVQYTLAITNFDEPKDPLRFNFGFIASSDNHRARPGTGYKEYARLANTEASGPRDKEWFVRSNPFSELKPARFSVPMDPEDPTIPAYLRVDFERQASFFMTGGLAAVHATGRSRQEIWQALKNREVFGTSGPRILLWFDLLNGSDGNVPMGGTAMVAETPRFRVRAQGSREQLPGCPDYSHDGLSPERLEDLCRGECYNPGDRRRPITRIEVVRIRPQVDPNESVEDLIEDPWRIFACPADGSGCAVEFDDPDLRSSGRRGIYYVRAIEAPSPAINAGALRCEYDWSGKCIAVDPCYGDYRTPKNDDCLSMNEERAWSSPIYVDPIPQPDSATVRRSAAGMSAGSD